ncbi:hypothetical protein Tamer19_62400 [Cupriavidus sp. TA19]|uniref:hypothetical protein n=1 Tax=Cupriavidus sp. TA19 TaxID=701108 RepID=UPI0027294A07|nr:hypothetical protein [Cupriavidus sp. TA19]GLC96831.1 hypothetical protein Tamer19_62400 [Cupriavidus sp. TA19]
MRTILAGVMVLGLAGCGLRYVGTEDQMQQVARGTAELMKKNPYGDMVSGAGTAAHMVLSATMGQQSEPEAKPQIIGGFGEEARAQHEAYKQFLLKSPSLYGRGTESTD